MIPHFYLDEIAQIEVEKRVKDAVLCHQLQEINGHHKKKAPRLGRLTKMIRQLELRALKNAWLFQKR